MWPSFSTRRRVPPAATRRPNGSSSCFAAEGRSATILAAGPGRTVADQARAAVEGGCRVAVAAGGDGTVNAVATAVLGRDIPPRGAPDGHAQPFCQGPRPPARLEEAVRVVSAGAVRRVDVGEVNGHVFLNNSSIGVYPRVLRLRSGTSSGPVQMDRRLVGGPCRVRRHSFMGVRVVADGETIVRRTPSCSSATTSTAWRGSAPPRASRSRGPALALHDARVPAAIPARARLAGPVARRGQGTRIRDSFWSPRQPSRPAGGGFRSRWTARWSVLASPLEYRLLPLALPVMGREREVSRMMVHAWGDPFGVRAGQFGNVGCLPLSIRAFFPPLSVVLPPLTRHAPPATTSLRDTVTCACPW